MDCSKCVVSFPGLPRFYVAGSGLKLLRNGTAWERVSVYYRILHNTPMLYYKPTHIEIRTVNMHYKPTSNRAALTKIAHGRLIRSTQEEKKQRTRCTLTGCVVSRPWSKVR